MYRSLDYNIDVNDAQASSAYPFEDWCTLTIGSVSLPLGCILSVRIACPAGCTLPARLSTVSRITGSGGGAMYRVAFTDAAETDVAHADISSSCTDGTVTSALLSEHGVLRGHMTYTQEFASLAAGAADAAGGKASANLVLRPECHMPWFTGPAQYIEADGTRVNGVLEIRPGILVHTEQGTGTGSCISVAGLYSEASGNEAMNGLCWLCVSLADADGTCSMSTPVWIGGKHVILRHSVESNIRVTGDGVQLSLKGVADA